MKTLSHSKVSKYMTCPRSFKFHYIDRIRPLTHSGALYFGSAMDKALNELLLPTTGELPEDIFLAEFAKDGRKTDINVVYADADLDEDLIAPEGLSELQEWLLSTKLKASDHSKFYSMLKFRKKNAGFDCLSDEEKSFYNYYNWLSMKEKGLLILRDYRKEILPKLDKVIAVQIEINHKIQNDITINGFIDFIAWTKDGKLAIFDNKTSRSAYEKDSVRTSPQLALYKEAVKLLMPELDITHAAYVVMRKGINKNMVKTCEVCGHVATGKHKTCDNEIDGERCGGKWDKVMKPEAEFQFIIDKIPQSYKDIVIDNYTEIHNCITKEVFPRNLSSCDNTYGGQCAYKRYCLLGDEKGLKKDEEK